MSSITGCSEPVLSPLGGKQRIELANRLFQEYHARCFWHSPRDLVITEDLIPLVVQGLRKHGGRRGFILSGRLRCENAATQSVEGELRECR
jgi:hypothetical protein